MLFGTLQAIAATFSVEALARDESDATREAELERARREYARREREIASDTYAQDRAVNLFFRQGTERALVRLLDDAGLIPLSDKKILDVGCGSGTWLRLIEVLGAKDLAGVDLDDARLAKARARLPAADLRSASVDALPFEDASFDVVSQFTVFTSILDESVRRDGAREMARVLKPGGAIAWYDFAFDNPRNRAVRGIRISELRRLFPGFDVRFERTTLAPPIARWSVPRFPFASACLERARFLNTHVTAVLIR